MNILYTIKKYVILEALFLRNQLMAQLEYRVNFIAGLLVETGYFLAKLTYVFVVIKTNLIIDDFGPYHIVVCIGVYVVLTGIYMLFWPSFVDFPDSIQSGFFDLSLVKPISPFFLAGFSKPGISMFLPNVTFGSVLIAYGWYKSGEVFIVTNFLKGLFFIFTGSILTYVLFFLPLVLSFWIIRVNKLHGILGSFWDFNNMPMLIYPNWLRKMGLYVLPIFVISNPAAFTFLNKGNLNLSIMAVLMPITFSFMLGKMWKVGLKKYHSATS